uniref:Immunoglobulin V-set domain-containing protein n=1 Tax=Gouania willdenowi TaxID=441366 RepID=A0A8C5DJS7_GOUWI
IDTQSALQNLGIVCITVCLCTQRCGDQITQSPLNVFKKTGENAAIRCSHSILDYNRILWYEQSKQKGMTFLTHMVGDSWIPEEGTPVTLTGSAKSNETCTLKTGKLTLESSAVYFCAVHSWLQHNPLVQDDQ